MGNKQNIDKVFTFLWVKKLYKLHIYTKCPLFTLFLIVHGNKKIKISLLSFLGLLPLVFNLLYYFPLHKVKTPVPSINDKK